VLDITFQFMDGDERDTYPPDLPPEEHELAGMPWMVFHLATDGCIHEVQGRTVEETMRILEQNIGKQTTISCYLAPLRSVS